jgi:phosphatidylserine/phosphatidylglycerophosphate/cardiolipin synthase-like enzyme
VADAPFAWDDLARYKAESRFLDGYPEDQRTFFAPRDNVHGVLVALLQSAQHSIVVNMYGYDDQELNNIIQEKLTDEHVYVQMSSVHNAISHLKVVIVDGVYTVKGSTNWSLSGQQKQDNELTLSRNAVVAAETRAILDLNHDFMLKQMVGTKLDTAKLMAKPAQEPAAPTPAN